MWMITMIMMTTKMMKSMAMRVMVVMCRLFQQEGSVISVLQELNSFQWVAIITMAITIIVTTIITMMILTTMPLIVKL